MVQTNSTSRHPDWLDASEQVVRDLVIRDVVVDMLAHSGHVSKREYDLMFDEVNRVVGSQVAVRALRAFLENTDFYAQFELAWCEHFRVQLACGFDPPNPPLEDVVRAALQRMLAYIESVIPVLKIEQRRR
jgi:hypothetical protein